jgi:hypothetical protein
MRAAIGMQGSMNPAGKIRGHDTDMPRRGKRFRPREELAAMHEAVFVIPFQEQVSTRNIYSRGGSAPRG